MKHCKLILIALIILSLGKISFSQNLINSTQNSEYTYIYKLDNSSALEILKARRILDSAKYYNNLVDSFLNVNPANYRKRLVPGQYLLYKTQGNNISFNSLEISDVIIKVNGINNKNNIYIYDLKGNPISDNIKLFDYNDEEIDFNKELECWTVDNTKHYSQSFYVLHNSALTYHLLKRNKAYSNKSKRKRSNTTILPGYFVLNQPIYKKNDSLIMKAFLLKRNGKPYNKTVTLKIYDRRTGKFNLIKDLKPVSRGAYTYATQIPDSFNLDSYYQIFLNNKKGQMLKTKSFKVENYKKKNASYNFRMEKNYFYKGEKAYLHLSCFDANGLPMADSKMDINVKITNIQNFYSDSMYIPHKWQSESYWSKKLYSDPSGNTEILLPDSLFLNAIMTFNATVKFINADGENTVRQLNFSYNPQQKRYLFYQEGDSIKAIFLENSEVKPKAARILSYYNNLLEDKQVTLPYTFHIQEFPKYYKLFSDSILISTVNPKLPNANLVKFEGYRNYDSLVISLNNKAGVDVRYWVYKKKDLLFEGNSTNVFLKEAIKGGKSIDVIYSYRLAGENYTFVRSFHHREKSLKIESDIPKKIFPGEEIVVKVNVKNHKGKNRKNVNLAAYAINAKVEGIESPDMPYFGKSKRGLFRTFWTDLPSTKVYDSRLIDTNYLEWLNLRKLDFYNFVYSKNGFILQYDSIESESTEFAPFMIHKGLSTNIYEIYIDNELRYFNNSFFRSPFSLRVKPGKHNVTLRSYDRFITINDVEFKKGFKLFLGVEQDSIYKFNNIESTKAKDQYLKEEQLEIGRNLLVFTNYCKKSFYIVQDEKIYSSANYKRNNSYGYIIVGPLKTGKIKVISSSLDTLEFFFQPGYVYQFTDTAITTNRSYNQNIANGAFGNRYKNLKNFDGKARANVITKAKVKTKIAPRKWVNPYLRFYNLNHTLKEYGSLRVKQLNPKQVTKTWLINSNDSVYSFYSQVNTKIIDKLKPGNYQLVYLSNDSLYFSKNINIIVGGTNFKYYSDSTFLPYDSVLIKRLENLVINLNTPKARYFTDPPKLITNYKSSLYKNKENKTYFKGNLLDVNSTPVNNAIIILEKEGVFISGAYTNLVGTFIFTDSLEGRYQMKIFIRNSSYNYYNVLITKNLTNNASILLPDFNFGHREYYGGESVEERAYYDNNNDFISRDECSSGSTITSAEISSLRRHTLGIRKISKAISNINLPKKEGLIATDPNNGINAEEKARYEALKNNTKSNRIRSKFRDYGFFIPNLITNRKGNAYFTVKFPDNQTMWKTYFPAVDYHKNTGLLEVDIQAYKPLSASIALPKFLIEGDICSVNGKISNYIGEAMELTPWYKIEADSNSLDKTSPKHFEVFPKDISFDKLGNKELTFGFKTQDEYLDAERRIIPVLVNGIEVSISKHYYAKNNFVVNYKADTNLISRTIFITNNQLDVLTEEINYLKNYNYGCNEQNASKIIALLSEKSIKTALDLPFEGKKTIKKLISKLEKNQNDDGSWGWWRKGNKPEVWMTIYITDVLNKATKSSFNSKSIFKALPYLESNLNSMNTSDRLYAIDILCNYYSPKKYKAHIDKIEKLKLNYFDKFRLISIKQKMGRPYSIQEVVQSSNRDKYGIYWGEKVMNFKVNIVQTSSLAYNILKKDKGNHKVILEETRNYFLTHLSKNRNTIERAILLQDITDDIIANNSIKKEIRSELKINGKLMPQVYPIHKTFKNTDNIYIEKTGAPLQISVYETSIQNPEKKTDTLFAVSTEFRAKGDTISSVKLAEKFQHYGKFYIKKTAEFVMLEIPIPAGAVYSKKNIHYLPYEVNREYHDDKVVIFFRKIPSGSYYFNINLESRFAGKFNVIPTKISLMYFPDVFGFSDAKEFRITK